MSLKEEVRKALRREIQSEIESSGMRSAKACKIISVSADPVDGLMTCDCEPIDGTAIIEDVKLIADNNFAGLILVPKENSVVIVSFKSESDGFVSMVSEIEAAYLNGNTFGGLIKIEELLIKINTIESSINAIATWAGTVTPPLAFIPLVPTQKTEIENTSVNHGDGTLV